MSEVLFVVLSSLSKVVLGVETLSLFEHRFRPQDEVVVRSLREDPAKSQRVSLRPYYPYVVRIHHVHARAHAYTQ